MDQAKITVRVQDMTTKFAEIERLLSRQMSEADGDRFDSLLDYMQEFLDACADDKVLDEKAQCIRQKIKARFG